MRLGVLKESGDERRVSIVPGSLKKLEKMGFEVFIESGALRDRFVDISIFSYVYILHFFI